MTILRLRTLIFRTTNVVIPGALDSGPDAPDSGEHRPKQKSTMNWALVALLGIIAIAVLEGYALNRGINGAALRAALVSIGFLGGAGIGRIIR